MSGVGYAHNQHICHRDMKLDNVLLSRPGCLREIKLADFGLSDFYRPGATMRTNCGSISYLAPEVGPSAIFRRFWHHYNELLWTCTQVFGDKNT